MPREWARVPARIKALRCRASSPDGLAPEPVSQPRWIEARARYRAWAWDADAGCREVQGDRAFRLRETDMVRAASPVKGRQGLERPRDMPRARMAAV